MTMTVAMTTSAAVLTPRFSPRSEPPAVVNWTFGGRLHIFDLRQETHIFYLLAPKTNVFTDGRAVSWYADRDWSNVGQSLDWITADEESQRITILTVPTTQLFTICEYKDDGHVTPISYTQITVKSAATEAMVVAQIAWRFSFPTIYHRLPVPDHCAPGDTAVKQLIDLVKQNKIDPVKDWVHFHCHGGDGRTTTFLALYDMVCWAKTRGTANFPSLQNFADRQCQLFDYSLNPDKDCGNHDVKPNWKYDLAVQRWRKLGAVRDQLAGGGLGLTDGDGLSKGEGV